MKIAGRKINPPVVPLHPPHKIHSQVHSPEKFLVMKKPAVRAAVSGRGCSQHINGRLCLQNRAFHGAVIRPPFVCNLCL